MGDRDFSIPYRADDVLQGRVPVAKDTRILNDWIIASRDAAPDPWSFTEDQVRTARRQGQGIFDLEKPSPHGETINIKGPRGPVPLRLIRPAHGGSPNRAYLHIHGGGWTFGEHDMQDESLQEIADGCNCLCLSVGYGLAPEHPYPAANDDCEVAALWLLTEGAEAYGLTSFAIGGESAGAHLSLTTLLRLRDKQGESGFCAANLVCGCFDLAMTPSMRNWGKEPLVLNTEDMKQFRKRYLPDDGQAYDLADPDISPLYGAFASLPPCLVTAGTKDALLDDSLFLHQRLLAAGNNSHLAVYPDGCHVFSAFHTSLAREARACSIAFLDHAFDGHFQENF